MTGTGYMDCFAFTECWSVMLMERVTLLVYLVVTRFWIYAWMWALVDLLLERLGIQGLGLY